LDLLATAPPAKNKTSDRLASFRVGGVGSAGKANKLKRRRPWKDRKTRARSLLRKRDTRQILARCLSCGRQWPAKDDKCDDGNGDGDDELNFMGFLWHLQTS
jgi:hypothetical protein